jgi:hypothetical protein
VFCSRHCSYSLLTVDADSVIAGANILLTSADPRPNPTPDVILSANMLPILGLFTASAGTVAVAGTCAGTFAVSKLLLTAVVRGILFICEVFVSSIFRFYN